MDKSTALFNLSRTLYYREKKWFVEYILIETSKMGQGKPSQRLQTLTVHWL